MTDYQYRPSRADFRPANIDAYYGEIAMKYFPKEVNYDKRTEIRLLPRGY